MMGPTAIFESVWNTIVDNSQVFAITVIVAICLLLTMIRNTSSIPGPKLYALTQWRLAYDDWKGTRTQSIHQLHQKYGPVVQIGPNEISFTSLSALKTIYGAGSGFERTSFYRMFDVYGYQNLFTFASSKDHSDRKKLLSHAYSKSTILKKSAPAIQQKTLEFMQLIEREPEEASEIFASLHYYSLDNITHFLYGPHGETSALTGSKKDRALLTDVLDPARRKLAWFAVHFPRYTKWLMSRTGVVEKAVNLLGLIPQKKPTVYTGIRQHALNAWNDFSKSPEEVKVASEGSTIVSYLWDSHVSQKHGGLSDLALASEAADHLLAGVDTTADTLVFLIWALSLPENSRFQEKLVQEVTEMSADMLDENGIPTAEASLKAPFLDAVIKETLRLYAPLPASEPRSFPVLTTIDGYQIPPNITVSMSPFSLHRNAEVYKYPLVFNPDRWLGDPAEVAEMKKCFWAFSSGARMCIGIHLAMVEMATLTAAIYRKYSTRVHPGAEDTSPGITSRFEVFYDESKPVMKEHFCRIQFRAR